MPIVSFDFNFWTVLFCLLNFGFSAYVLITARSSALVQKIHNLELDVVVLKNHLEKIQTLERDIISLKDNQSKLHAVEVEIATIKANQSNAIKHDDLAAVYKRLEELSQSVNKLIGKLDSQPKTWWNR